MDWASQFSSLEATQPPSDALVSTQPPSDALVSMGLDMDPETWLEQFPDLEEKARIMFRGAAPEVQLAVITKGSLQGARDQTAVLISRIKNLADRLAVQVSQGSTASECQLDPETWLMQYPEIEDKAKSMFLSSGHEVQQAVIARGTLHGARDKTAVLITRVKNFSGSQWDSWSHQSSSGANLLPPGEILKMRGLPFGASKADVVEFFSGFDLSEGRIFLGTDASGRPSGEAWVSFGSLAHAEFAKQSLHKKQMGHRYIELFPSSAEEVGCSWDAKGGKGMTNMMNMMTKGMGGTPDFMSMMSMMMGMMGKGSLGGMSEMGMGKGCVPDMTDSWGGASWGSKDHSWSARNGGCWSSDDVAYGSSGASSSWKDRSHPYAKSDFGW